VVSQLDETRHLSIAVRLSPREVAAILGLSPNVVRIRAHRARLKLREELRSESPANHATG
jgi:DNA-directed RNA polymerase specialized sigma24 family protein